MNQGIEDLRRISNGPSLEQIEHSLFFDYENKLGNDGMVGFIIDDGEVCVTIDAAKRLEDGEWELECSVDLVAGGWHFATRYSVKTKTGTVLRYWQE